MTASVADLSRRQGWTAAELMGVDFPEPRWAVPGIVAEGLTLLVGAPKLGKSWLSLNLGVAIASGGIALGRIPVEQGDVAYLALEDTGRRLQNRLRRVLGNSPAPDRLHLATTCEPIPEGGDERIGRWLTAHPDARLVVVDVLARVRGRTSERANRYESDYHAVTTLKDIADDHGVAMVVVHHTRKGGADDFIDTVSGTQGLVGAADAVAVLARSRGSAGAVLRVAGRDVEETDHALDFDAATGSWKLLDGPASDYEVSEQRRQILTAVRDSDGIGPKAIAAATGIGYDTVRHLVRAMVAADQLDTDGSGHYFAATPSPPLHLVHTVHTSPPPVKGVNGVKGEHHDEGDAS